MSTKKTQNTIGSIEQIARTAPYNDERRKQFKSAALKFLKEIASELGLAKSDFDARYNPGGIAGSGDAILHTDHVYVHINNFGAYWRLCNGRKDYCGEHNRATRDEHTAKELAADIKRAVAIKAGSVTIRNERVIHFNSVRCSHCDGTHDSAHNACPKANAEAEITTRNGRVIAVNHLTKCTLVVRTGDERAATAVADKSPDFTVANHGSICILTGQNEICRGWIEAHVGDENTQTWGQFGIVVEPRYIGDIIKGLQAEGFTGEGF